MHFWAWEEPPNRLFGRNPLGCDFDLHLDQSRHQKTKVSQVLGFQQQAFQTKLWWFLAFSPTFVGLKVL